MYLPIAETRDYEPTLDVIDNDVSIMVVDDDPGVVRVVRNALTRSGYSVRGFTDVGAAKEFFTPQKVSLLITDVVMPGESGADLARDLRKKAPALPVLFVSEQNELTDYLAKPFRSEEVISRVEQLLSGQVATRKMLG